ncbi:MMPL family transporter [Streptomyces sp. NPDC052236]|uniref:MMPL family transporter n=1 Tax=Streptomyces sp. NPDC052236 TaxID=3365686 RepID=UPI0037D2BFFC
MTATAFQWIFQRSVSDGRDRCRMTDEQPHRPGPLTRLGLFAVRRSGAVLITALLLFLGLGAYGAGAQSDLDLSRWDAPGTESVAAAGILREEFSTGNPNLALLVTARGGDIDAPDTARAARALAAEVEKLPMVTDVSSYWSDGDGDGGNDHNAALRGKDGRHALILARLEGSATETREELATLSPRLTRTTDQLTVRVGGQEEISRQVGEQARQDFLTAEILVLPAVVLLLILVYRRTAAALVTVGVGLLSVVSTLAGLRALSQLTPVSTFAANIALVLGLGSARLPVLLPQLVRVRRNPGRRAGHGRSGPRPARRPRPLGTPDGARHRARRERTVAPGSAGRHAPAAAQWRRGSRRAAARRFPAARPAIRAAGRTRPARGHLLAYGLRNDPP